MKLFPLAPRALCGGILLAALALIPASGCVTPAGTHAHHGGDVVYTTPHVVEVEPLHVASADPYVYVPPPVPHVLNSVEFLTPSLVDQVQVTNTTYERTRANTFRVTATLKNLSDQPLRLQARTQFFTDDRRPKEGPGAWQIVFLPPNSISTYTSYSYGKHDGYYYVEVLEM